MFRTTFGEYRFLIVTVPIFLALNIGVIYLIFYSSSHIAEQTARAELVGRQHTLTQQLSQAAMYLDTQDLQRNLKPSDVGNLRAHYELFGQTLEALTTGGHTYAVLNDHMIQVNPVTDQRARAILNDANRLWLGYQQAINPVVSNDLANDIKDKQIRPALHHIAQNNILMSDLMLQLAELFSNAADQKSRQLRIIKLSGIGLSILSFLIILLYLLIKINARNKSLQAKFKQSQQIFGAIRAGIFVVDRDQKIGAQHSAHIETLFNTKHIAGLELGQFLQPYLSHRIITVATEFLQLCQNQLIDPDLIDEVNPLKGIAAKVRLDNGDIVDKYIDFTFAPFIDEQNHNSTLVIISEVTDAVLLAEHTEQSEMRLEQQVSLISQMLPINAKKLQKYVHASSASLEHVKYLLSQTEQLRCNYRLIFQDVINEIRDLNSAAIELGFIWVTDQSLKLENIVQNLIDDKTKSALSDDDFGLLRENLNALSKSFDKINVTQQQLSQYGVYQTLGSEPVLIESNQISQQNNRWLGLHTLVSRLAKHGGVKAQLHLRGFNQPLPNYLNDKLYCIADQIIRKAMVYEIETGQIRQHLKKPDIGQLVISISHDRQGNYRFVFEDDGRGFDYQAIRDRLKNIKGWSDYRIAKMRNSDLIGFSFGEMFSSRGAKKKDNPSEIQMNSTASITAIVRELGGKLKIRSVTNEFTRFVIEFKYQEQENELIDTLATA